ncbi:unnamed protein product [Notodromas monacha]|uniref:MABP1/WDR62 second WD40 domain-containing protein n=1 Tax=Notodromas monacha TaxID=399045 RepID=A0A7R9BIY6_9CRUS|nr:unnamed protein product [Notodromas monacha]CAG0915557.1 unnamed protein product [Notodromas monacha]
MDSSWRQENTGLIHASGCGTWPNVLNTPYSPGTNTALTAWYAAMRFQQCFNDVPGMVRKFGQCSTLKWSAWKASTFLSGSLAHIHCGALSNKYLVSVGSQHDQVVNVWDWGRKTKLACNKASTKVKAVDFAENGGHFVAVGNRQVKFWYFKSASADNAEPDGALLTGRCAILGEQGTSDFVDVGCGRGDCEESTFAVAKSGILCEFNSERLLCRWVDLRMRWAEHDLTSFVRDLLLSSLASQTTCARALSVGFSSVVVGCDDGIVRCFDTETLLFKTTLPRSHYLGVDVSKGLGVKHMSSEPRKEGYPTCVGVRYDESSALVTCIYDDHSLYVWDIQHANRVGKSHSFLFHSGGVWAIEGYPAVGNGAKTLLPPGSFITCSADDTIRIWNLDPKMTKNTSYKRNVYSNELIKTLYVDENLTHLRDVNRKLFGSSEKESEGSMLNQSKGVRCIKISHDGKHLASGDRSGYIRVYNMQSMEQIVQIEAHDSEILALEYSGLQDSPKLRSKPRSYLASAARDRLLHVFAVHKDYDTAQTLADHSSAVTCLRFAHPREGGVRLMSGSSDRSIVFREFDKPDAGDGTVDFTRYHDVTARIKLLDMEIDRVGQKLLTVGNDRLIHVYQLSTGMPIRNMKGTRSEEATLVKVTLDPSGQYAATSSSDKAIYLIDYSSGEVIAMMTGHAEIVTGLFFTADCRHLISVSGDSCIFVWRLSSDMTRAMLSRLKKVKQGGGLQFPLRQATLSAAKDNQRNSSGNVKITTEEVETQYQFSIGQLPSWAKKKIENPGSLNSSQLNISTSSAYGQAHGSEFPKGRWAQRIDSSQSQSLTVRSHHFSDTSIPFPTAPVANGVNDSESSKESSSLESNTETSAPMLGTAPRSIGSDKENRRHPTDESSVTSFPREDDEADHEGDIDEDFSEPEEYGEGFSYDIPIYVPTCRDSQTSYTVMEANEEMLRRESQSDGLPNDLQNVSSTSFSGSLDSDLELEGESGGQIQKGWSEHAQSTTASTPSVDHGVSVSYESLDAGNQQSISVRSPMQEKPSVLKDSAQNLDLKISLSVQNETLPAGYADSQASGSVRKLDALQQEPQQREIRRSRLELQRQIEETRRKLDSLGRPGLRGSVSISDLSRTVDSDIESNGNHSRRAFASGATKSPSNRSERYVSVSGNRDSGIMRRACSLSDLTGPLSVPRRILPAPPTQGKKTSQDRVQVEHRQRSPSVGNIQARGLMASGSRLNVEEGSSASKARRRSRSHGLSSSQSIGDLRHRRGADDPSSSEENFTLGRRSRIQDPHKFGGSQLELSRDSMESLNNRLTPERQGKSTRPTTLNVNDSSSHRRKHPPVNRQLCEKATSDLMCVSRKVSQLFNKLYIDPTYPEGEKRGLLQRLGHAAMLSRDELGRVIEFYAGDGQGHSSSASVSQRPVSFAPVMGPSPAFPMTGVPMQMGNPVVVQLMQQFVALMQQQPTPGVVRHPEQSAGGTPDFGSPVTETPSPYQDGPSDH